jgi:hypothetical protein
MFSSRLPLSTEVVDKLAWMSQERECFRTMVALLLSHTGRSAGDVIIPRRRIRDTRKKWPLLALVHVIPEASLSRLITPRDRV